MRRILPRSVLVVALAGIPVAVVLTSYAAPGPTPPSITGTPVIDQAGHQGFWFHSNQLGTPLLAHEEAGGGTVLIFQTKAGTISRVVLDEKGAHVTHTLTPFP